MAEDRSRNPFEAFKVEIDPDRIDESVRALTDRLAQLVEQGRHVKVRLKYRGRPLMKDIPLSVVAAAQIAGGAVEVASLGEAFGFAVERFGESNRQLTEALARIEAALAQSLTRSDEQLAYYVAQAREIIDLSVMSQKQIVENLQQLSSRQASLAGEA